MRFRWFIAAVVAVSAGICLLGASGTTQVAVEVRPEANVVRTGSEYTLKIRLSRNTYGYVWRDDTCSVPPPHAHVVTRSGTYGLNTDLFSQRSGSRLCVASSDTSLKIWIPYPI